MPAPWETAYERALRDARRAIFDARAGIVTEAAQHLYDAYADALARIYSLLDGGALPDVQARRQRALAAAIRRELARLSFRLESRLEADVRKVLETMAEGHAAGLAAAADAAGLSVSASFAEVPRDAMAAMMVRRGLGQATTFRTLIRRRLRGMAGDVDRFLASTLARGVGAPRATKDLALLLARDDPRLLEALRRLGPRGGRLVSEIAAGAPPVDPGQVVRAKSLLSDARRIYVTETNTALMEGDRVAAVRSPVLDVVIWQLSGRHRGLPSSPDECDVLAQADPHGLGPGHYFPETVPARPHPLCACFFRYRTRSPAQWTQPKRRPRAPRLLDRADVRRIYGRSGTDHAVDVATDRLNERLRTAHEVWAESG